MGLLVGVADVTGQLVFQGFGISSKGSSNRRLIAALLLQPAEIDGGAVNTGGGAGLKPAERNAQRAQAFAEVGGGVHAVRSRFFGILADENFAL